MSRKKRKNLPQKLVSLFKMTPEQLATHKRSGAGAHKSGPKYKNRSVQKRRAIEDQTQD